MKGNDKILAVLNDLLSDELTAINQYIVHSEMCADWRYEKLHKAIEGRDIEEMGHAEKLIGRILFLEGTPIVSNLKKMHIGATVEEQHQNDRMSEVEAVAAYNGRSSWPSKSATTARANCSSPPSPTKKSIWTGWKPNSTRSSRWASRTIWSNRWINHERQPDRRPALAGA